MFIRKVTMFVVTMGLVLLIPLAPHLPQVAAQETRQPLNPLTIPKFVEQLVIPPVMESTGNYVDSNGNKVTQYQIAARQFEQQVLPTGFPKTTVFGYGNPNKPETFNFPSFTVETRSNEWVEVEWLNQLVDDPTSATPKYLSHILPVDQTLHWANPLGQKDAYGDNIEPYTGPVPTVVHLHGAHVPAISDGYPEAWYLPAASNLPAGAATQGTFYGTTKPAQPGSAIFLYPNSQPAATLWYHDHTLGMTRLNVYAGLAGFWLLRDDTEDKLNLPGPAPKLGDPAGTRYYEIPLAIQDRSFYSDGSLFYPDNRQYFDDYQGKMFPDSPVRRIWNPEFFGNTMLVNGKTWPYVEVEPRLYRLRLLNGTNARFMILKFDRDITFHQIGGDGGLLADKPITDSQLLLAPSERDDVIVDFSQFKPGDTITLLNVGPDSPFGGLPIDPEELADPETTGQIMQFRIVEGTNNGNAGEIPTTLPAIERLQTTLPDRYVTLHEEMFDDVPVGAFLGSLKYGLRRWMDPITENPMVNDTEVWTIVNLTMDAHPIHLHMVQFQVVERIPIDKHKYEDVYEDFIFGRHVGNPPDPRDYITGEPRGAEPDESGWKDNVIAYPGELTRIIARFDREGLYVWHCHILEHEDNEMMRPYYIGKIPPDILAKLNRHANGMPPVHNGNGGMGNMSTAEVPSSTDAPPPTMQMDMPVPTEPATQIPTADATTPAP